MVEISQEVPSALLGKAQQLRVSSKPKKGAAPGPARAERTPGVTDSSKPSSHPATCLAMLLQLAGWRYPLWKQSPPCRVEWCRDS